MDEKYYRAKFVELGLSDGFDFIGRDYSSYKGRKVFIRCKECGTEFSTWAFSEIIKGRQSRLLCVKCGAASDGADVWTRSPKCDDAMEFYTQGHSVKETAELFGVPEHQINNAVKARGMTNGRDWREAAIESTKRRGEQAREVREAKRLETKAERERQAEERRQQKKAEKERIKREREAERKAEREAKAIEKNPLGLSYYQLEREKKLDEVFTCKECGKKYTPRQYMESAGLTLFSNVGYCSNECKRKSENRKRGELRKKSGIRDSHRHRAVKYGCKYDSSVTLPKLIKLNGLRCGICGEMCDPSDHKWSKYSGPTYPSIDHIVPMSKGGGHTWDNVQVAHIMCNSEKGNKVAI